MKQPTSKPYDYIVQVAPTNPRPYDEGLILHVGVVAPSSTQAMVRVRRYVPGTITGVQKVNQKNARNKQHQDQPRIQAPIAAPKQTSIIACNRCCVRGTYLNVDKPCAVPGCKGTVQYAGSPRAMFLILLHEPHTGEPGCACLPCAFGNALVAANRRLFGASTLPRRRRPLSKRTSTSVNKRICPVNKCPGGYCDACIRRYGY